MNQVYLSDREIKDNLYPLTLTRSAADIRVGILTIREKWRAFLGAEPVITSEENDLQDTGLILSANIVPGRRFVDSLFNADGTASENPAWDAVKIIQYPWHIFQWNDWAIREDFHLITAGRQSEPIPATVQTIDPQNIFIEKGAKITHCIINAEGGPVYIGKNATVMEGTMIRGPVAICEHATIKMGAKIYEATTIGPHSVAGGEIKSSVIFGYSNKSHDGYLGNSVIGEWCNMGAGTSTSNMKNNASEIRMWSHTQQQMILSGINKCGLIMGDHSRAAINTSFNTGTTVGVSANIFGEGPVPKYVPSFSWGGRGPLRYQFEKAVEDIDKWKKLKHGSLSEREKTMLRLIFDQIK
jgi:UDP-N-acetylglucosamine diphosphorylase/glucosamine-1-phosphate N-acetyltransferase